jgi:hypothetical protein
MSAAKFKVDALSIGLAVAAVIALVAGAILVSGHPKRGGLAFVIAVLLGAGAVYASMNAAKQARHRRHGH